MKVNQLKFFSLFLALLILSACSSIKDIFVEDVQEEPPAELTEFTAEIQPQTLWAAKAGDGAGETLNDMGLWLQKEQIFAIDHDGELYAFNATDGHRIWEKDLDASIVTGVGGNSTDTVYVGTQKGELIAIKDTDGSVLWHQQLSSEVLAPATGNETAVVVRTSDGRVTALAPDTGATLWSYQRAVPLLSLRGASRPVIADDKVIAGYDNGKLVALSIADGKVIWEKSVAVPRGRTELERLVDIDADPVVINDTAYAVTFHGNVAAVDLLNGRVKWSREMSSKTGIDVAYGDAVYVTDDQSYIWAIQDLSGDALWRQTRLLRRQASPPSIVGDYLIVGDFQGYLHWISRDDGRFVGRVQLGDSAIKTKPLVYDGIAYVYAVDGTISAVRVP